MTTEFKGTTMRRLRKAAGKTQSALATHLRVSTATVSRWEDGAGAPSSAKWAEALEWLQGQALTGKRRASKKARPRKELVYVPDAAPAQEQAPAVAEHGASDVHEPEEVGAVLVEELRAVHVQAQRARPRCRDCGHLAARHGRRGCEAQRSTGGGQVHACACEAAT